MELSDAPKSMTIKPVEIESTLVNSLVVTPFCVTWSSDNKISFIANGGVYVYELWPTPLSEQQSITFLKYWIPAPTESPLSKAVVDDHNGAFLWSLRRKQAFETTIDTTLALAVMKTSHPSQIIQAEFSPLVNGKSYISCLSNNGLVEVYKFSLNKWQPILNVTQLWVSHCDIKSNSEDITYDYFKTKMFEVKITTIKWFEKPELLFITGHESGLIVCWSVLPSGNSLEMNVKHKIQVDGKPHALELVSIPESKTIVLFVGMVSGTVKYLSVNLTTGEVHKSFDLWHDEDLLLPNLIKALYMENKLLIFIVKHHILLIQTCSVNSSGELLSTNWQEFPSAIVSWQEYQSDYVICLQNHDVYVLSLKDDSVNDVKLIEMGIKPKHKSCYHCYGLAMSPNEGIWILVSSAKVSSASMKEITQLMIYSPEIKIFKTLSHTTSSELLERILEDFPDTRLSHVFDLLELKRLELVSGAAKFKESYFDSEGSLMRFQLMLWEVKLKSFGNCDPELDSIAAWLEVLIVKKQAEKMVAHLVKPMSELQNKSLVVCQEFLNVERESVKGKEICRVCGEESFFENIRISSCPNSHKFPRCCLSLLPCDVTPYAVCRYCDSVALPNFVTERDNRCTFCDGLLELDTRLRAGS